MSTLNLYSVPTGKLGQSHDIFSNKGKNNYSTANCLLSLYRPLPHLVGHIWCSTYLPGTGYRDLLWCFAPLFAVLNRKRMINLALLCGSDYTDGIQGIGPVTAMEVLGEFAADDVRGLQQFK